MTPPGEALERVRFLVERLNRATGARRIDTDLGDMVLAAIHSLFRGRPLPQAGALARSALDAVEQQAELLRETRDDLERRRLEMYLALPTDPVQHRRPHMAGELASAEDEEVGE